MSTHDLESRVQQLEGLVKDLQARVQVTEDINDIKQVQWTYLNALMATEWDTCADCFSENALVDVYLHDPVPAARTSATGSKRNCRSPTRAPKATSASTRSSTSTATTATGNWLLYMMYFYKRTGQSMFWVQGYYDKDTSARTAKWKISVMRWHETIGLPGGGPPTGLW